MKFKKLGFVIIGITIVFVMFFVGKLLNGDVSKIRDMLALANENYKKINSDVKIAPFSEEYLKWLELPKEEKAKAIRPRAFTVKYESQSKPFFKFEMPNLSESGDIYPSSYNLVDKKCTIPVKNQRTWGYCWAYAGTTSLESFMLNKTRSSINEDCDEITVDYNPMHIGYSLAYNFANGVYNPYGNKDLDAGGNSVDNLVYFSSGIGPVSSTNFPITSEFDKEELKGTAVLNNAENFQLNNMYLFPQIDISTSSTSELNDYVNLIKKTILEKGAVNFASGGPAEGVSFYNPITFAVKTNSLDEAYSVPHMMTIVGWDDSFSKNNFSLGHIPNNDGAWIVQNSWGTDYGNNGFYYYSYEDYGLNIWDMAAISEVEEIDYDKMYQYNPTGEIMNASGKYAINVFNKTDELTEYINEISIFNFYKDVTYNIYINPDFQEAGLTGFNLVKTYIDNNDFAEYKTIDLDTPIEITGDKFAIMIEVIDSNAENSNIPVQLNAHNSLSDSGVGINPEQGYISTDGIDWSDAASLAISNQLGKVTGASIMVKAFTNIDESETTVSIDASLSNNSIALGVDPVAILSTSTTLNVLNNEDLTYQIKTTEDINVTDLFTFTKSKNQNIHYAEILTTSVNHDALIQYQNFNLIISYNGVSKTLPFSITRKMIESFKLTETEVFVSQIDMPLNIKFLFDISPYDCFNNEFIYEVGDSNIIEVVDNRIVTKANGVTTVTIRPNDGSNLVKTLKVNVVDIFSVLTGTGEETDPFIIDSIEKLKYLNLSESYRGYYFKLTTDLDLTEATSEGGIYYNNGLGFDPIGYVGFNYDGNERMVGLQPLGVNFDGDGHTISGLNINRPDQDKVALFSHVYNGEVKNLTIDNSNIIGNDQVAGFVGYAFSNTNLSNLKNHATILGNWYVAGIVSQMSESSIEKSYNKGNITAIAERRQNPNGSGYFTGGYVGGIVSESNYSTINKVFNSGNVKTVKGDYDTVCAAGIVCRSGETQISNAYNSGEVYAGFISSGIVGETMGPVDMTNVYNIGNITVDQINHGGINYNWAGGLISYIDDYITDWTFAITNSYDVQDEVPMIASASASLDIDLTGSVEKTIEQLKETGNYDYTYDFVNIWQSNVGSFPTLQGLSHVFAKEIISNKEAVNISINEEDTVEIEITPIDADMKDLLYETCDSIVASCDFTDLDNGIIKIEGKSKGETSFKISTTDGSNISKVINVNVSSGLENILDGTGTTADPYLITSVEELTLINNDKGASYKLTTDLDLTEATSEGGIYYNDGLGWDPIGTYGGYIDPETMEYILLDNAFYGSFDGDGHTIEGLMINRPNDNAGLFGFVQKRETYEKPVIKNIHIVDSNILGNFAGSIAAEIMETNILNVSSSANVSGYFNAGGIVGSAYFESNIENTVNRGKVIAFRTEKMDDYMVQPPSIGGIAGNFGEGSIKTSYNTGEVTGIYFSGGIAGGITNSTIENVYNTGKVIGFLSGGITANTWEITISNVYNTGYIDATTESNFGDNSLREDRFGSLIGRGSWITIENSYYESPEKAVGNLINQSEEWNPITEQVEIIEVENVLNNVVQKSPEDLRGIETYTGFDFENIWEVRNDGALPTLKSLPYDYIISLESESIINLEIGNSIQLEYEINPISANNKKLGFNSSNPEIATINEDGLITAVTSGNALITVSTTDGSLVSKEILVMVPPEDYDDYLTSSTYNVEDRLIIGVSEKTSYEDFITNLSSMYGEIMIDDNDGYIRTGTEVKIVAGNQIIATFTIVIEGDTDGDGEITAGDALDIILHSIGRKTMTGAYLEAAEVDDDGEVTAGDALDIILYTVGRKLSL